MIVYPFDQPVIWHVCFHDEPRWWGRFSHVSLAGFSGDTWLHLDLQRAGVSCALLYAHDDVQDYLEFLLGNYTVLRVGACQGSSRAFLRPLTCVSFVKHTLGVRSSALRPDGLFQDLLRNHGAECLNETEGSRPDAGTTAADGSGGAAEPARRPV